MTRTCNNTFPSKGFKGDGKAGFWSPKGGAESPEGDSPYAYPARGSFSVKKRNQKSLGEDPETPYASVHPV